MAQVTTVVGPTLVRELNAFLALEAPFLAAKLPFDLTARDLARARTELGWTPRTLDAGLPPTVRHIQATG